MLHKQSITTSIVTLVNLARFYTKIGRNYVISKENTLVCLVAGTFRCQIVNDALL